MSNYFELLREQFPSVMTSINGKIPIYLDGPGGTQVPQSVIDAIAHYLSTCNANHGGAFATSQASDAILADAQQAMADFLNAPSASEIVFGLNMTTLTFHLSRSIAHTWKEGDEVIVTRLDHDANIRPWTLAARDSGATARFIDFDPGNGTLCMDELQAALNEKTRLVAIGAASNLLGTINDIPTIVGWAKEVGALVFVDAVHYAPHGPIDVQQWDCDFLACSAYKFFGPHVGILWGKRQWLEELQPYKVRPASDAIPDRWMTGTQNHEGIAGTAAAVDYLASIGNNITQKDNRRENLHQAMATIQAYEKELALHLLTGLAQRPRFKVRGIADPELLDHRAPTVAISGSDCPPETIAQHLAKEQIFTWAGHMYALEVTERLGVEDKGGLLRLGLVHYNTHEEIDRLLSALDKV